MIIGKPKILILISVTLSILILSCSSNSINEDIVYSANKNGNTDIYKITLKDFEVTRLTTNEEIDTQPRWSNNKSKIAFLSKRSSDWSLYIMDKDGESEKPLISKMGDIEDYSWGPKSEKIAVQINDGISRWISVVNVEDEEINHLTQKSENATLGGWSPDGEWLLFSIEGDLDNPGIRKKNPAGVDEVMVTSGKDSNANWSPDGKWIAFNRLTEDGSNDLYLHNINENQSQNIAPDDYDEKFLTWSKESKLLFTSVKEGNTEIYKFDPKNNNETRLTNNRVEDNYPVWNDSGKLILFRSMNDGDYDLYYMKNSGENQQRITNTSYEIIDADW